MTPLELSHAQQVMGHVKVGQVSLTERERYSLQFRFHRNAWTGYQVHEQVFRLGVFTTIVCAIGGPNAVLMSTRCDLEITLGRLDCFVQHAYMSSINFAFITQRAPVLLDSTCLCSYIYASAFWATSLISLPSITSFHMASSRLFFRINGIVVLGAC